MFKRFKRPIDPLFYRVDVLNSSTGVLGDNTNICKYSFWEIDLSIVNCRQLNIFPRRNGFVKSLTGFLKKSRN